MLDGKHRSCICILLCTNFQGAQKVFQIFVKDSSMNTHVTVMAWHNAQDHFFKTITKPIYAYLNTLCHILTVYLEDSLLVAAEYNDCVTIIADVISMFDKLSFVVQPSKYCKHEERIFEQNKRYQIKKLFQ